MKLLSICVDRIMLETRSLLLHILLLAASASHSLGEYTLRQYSVRSGLCVADARWGVESLKIGS